MDTSDTPAKPVHAVYANGLFRPTEPVELPENCRVEFIPKVVDATEAPPIDPDSVLEVLMRRSSSGRHDIAERHNEHQP